MSKFPLYFTVDMKQVVNVSRITLDAGTQDTYDAPGQMDVLLSEDGTNYTTVVAAHKPVSPSNGTTSMSSGAGRSCGSPVTCCASRPVRARSPI